MNNIAEESTNDNNNENENILRFLPKDWTSVNAWVDSISKMVGPTGVTGPQGFVEATGYSGMPEVRGPTGVTGPPGLLLNPPLNRLD